MAELILPTARLHPSFVDCLRDWGPGPHEDGFGLGDSDDVSTPERFAAWVDDRLRRTHPAGTPCPDERHGSPRWIARESVGHSRHTRSDLYIGSG